MIRNLLAATAVLMISTAAQAQQAAPASPDGAQGGPATDIALLLGAQLSQDCGGLGLAGRAYCVTAPLGQIGALADAYIADLEGRQWLAAGGDENRVVFVKRRDAGGCDGLQMVAFYDTTKPAVAELPAYLGFATIPGDVCAAQPAAPTTAPANGNSPQ